MKRVPRKKADGDDQFNVHAYEETLNVPLRALVQSVHYGTRKIQVPDHFEPESLMMLCHTKAFMNEDLSYEKERPKVGQGNKAFDYFATETEEFNLEEWPIEFEAGTIGYKNVPVNKNMF